MSLLWAISPLVLLGGAALSVVQLRGMAEAAGALRSELQRFGEVHVAVTSLRSAAADLRATSRTLHRA